MKKWICLILKLLVFVGVWVVAFLLPEEVFTKAVIGFSIFCLIGIIKEM